MIDHSERTATLVSARLCLRTAAHSYDVRELSVYRFRVTGELPAEASEGGIQEGELARSDDGSAPLHVRFRVRESHGGLTDCLFHDLSLEQQQRVEELARSLDDAGRSDALNRMTYDELARGGISSGESPGDPDRSREKSSTSTPRRSLALSLIAMVLTIGTLAALVIVVLLIRGHYSIDVRGGALTGNYLPLNSRIEGEIVEMLVEEGDAVRKGTPLVRVANRTKVMAEEIAESRLVVAEEEVAAWTQRLESYERKQGVVLADLEAQLAAARAALRRAAFEWKVCRERLERMKRLKKRGAATGREVEEVALEAAALEAEHATQEALVAGLVARCKAGREGVLIGNGRVVSELDEIRAKLAIAVAVKRQRERELALARREVEHLVLRAPCDGTVYAIYRRRGEYLKRADDVLAIALDGETWATGTVSPGDAPLVKPGQYVRVRIPSVDRRVSGRIVAVGHRAVYGKGGYSAEFRAAAGDVPIKILLREMPETVQPGTRLEMTIKRDLGSRWMNWLIGNPAPDRGTPEVARTHASEEGEQ